MPLLLLLTVAFAVFFYRVATCERLSPLAWGLASVAVTGIVVMIGFGTVPVIVAQIGLFAVSWWYDARHKQEQMRDS